MEMCMYRIQSKANDIYVYLTIRYSADSEIIGQIHWFTYWKRVWDSLSVYRVCVFKNSCALTVLTRNSKLRVFNSYIKSALLYHREA